MYDKYFVLRYWENLKHRVKKTEKIFKRELKLNFVKNKPIFLTGPRRAGKTYLLLDIFRSTESIYLDFEHPSIKYVNVKEVFEIIDLINEREGKSLNKVLLDEVQIVRDWESLIRGLLDDGFEIIASGSSSKLLPKEMVTTLRGRALSYLLLPASFKEFLNIKNVKLPTVLSLRDKVKIQNLLEEYMTKGGFIEPLIYEDLREKILKEYFDTIFYKDFVERFSINDPNIARICMEFLFQNFSCEISINKISRFVSSIVGSDVKNKVYEYVSRLPETLSVFFVERYNKSLYKRKSEPKKVYICDTGLASVLLFDVPLGRLMENIVFLELLRKTNERPLMEIYYYKDNGYEIDFLIKEGPEIKELIQVTYASSFDEINPREYRAMIRASDLFKETKLTIITWDYEDQKRLSWFGKEALINFVPLWKWLL